MTRPIVGLLALALLTWPLASSAREEDPSTRMLELMARGAAASEGGCGQECLTSFAEAIALADRLAADPSFAPNLGVYVRAQLAETLRARDQHADAEAAAWDALDLAASLGDLDAAGPPMRLVILSVIDQGADRALLADLVTELDLVLGPVEAYRMHVSPPPEPIAVMLEGMARELAAAGEVELARESFAALVELDAAREAHWRGSADMAQLAWAALQAGDLRQAAWAHEIAGLRGRTLDVSATGAALSFERGSGGWRSDLENAVEQAAEEGDSYRQAVLLGRLAGLLRHVGEVDLAVKTHREAASLFDQLERPGDAALDRARGALALALDGRFELAMDELASATTPLGEGPRPWEVEDVVQRIDRQRLLAGELPRDEAAVVLARVERHLFEAERADELVELALQHVTWAVEDGEGADEAVAAIAALQEQVGLTRDGWQAAWARGMATSGAARIEAWQEATRAMEWALTHPLPDDRVAGEPPPEPIDPERLHRELLAELVAAGRWREALDVAERIRAIRRLALDAQRPTGSELQRVRTRMREVSFRGGERPPAEVRAELSGVLEELFAAEEAAVAALPEGLRLLTRIEGLSDEPLPPGTLGLVCFLRGEQVYIVLLDGDEVTKVSSPGVQWLGRMLQAWHDAPPKKKRKRRRPVHDHATELGHLFGKVGMRLAEAERIVWVPAGPLEQIPLEGIPLPDGRLIGDVTPVRTFASLREATLPPAPAPTGWKKVGEWTSEAELALPEGTVAWFDTSTSLRDRPAFSRMKLRDATWVGRATEPPPADGWLEIQEVLAAGWRPAAVVLPGQEHLVVGAWPSAWLVTGAGAVVWPLGPVDPDVDDTFVETFRQRIETGATVEQAFAAAQARVRKRWPDPRDWGNRVLSMPVSAP